jgi:hypothetical protein
MRLALALTLGGIALVAACAAFAPIENDPVPLPADLSAIIETQMGPRLRPADGSVPPISAARALEIASESLLAELKSNSVPAQDTSVPDGLIRRQVIAGPGKPLTSVWVVVYRWKAGFDCHNAAGGPGPCKATSFYFVDDRRGEMNGSYTDTRN